MSAEGEEITAYDTPGELVVRSPSVVLGYLNNDKATKETFEDGWMRTGDEAVIKLGPKGTEHVFIVDRIKELIKVKVRQCSSLIYLCTVLTNRRSIGSPSSTRRAGSSPSNPPRGFRLCCYRHS